MNTNRQSSWLLIVTCLLTVIFVGGCMGKRADESAKVIVITPALLDSSLIVIQALEPHLDKLDDDFQAFPNPVEQGLAYFDAQQLDQMEGLLFSFLAGQTSLWDIVNGFGGLGATFSDDLINTKADVLATTAALLIIEHTAFVVNQFSDKPLAMKLINQDYYRSDIPLGTYDRMVVSMTSPDLLDALVAAQEYYAIGLADPQSSLAVLAQTNPVYAALIQQLPVLHDAAAEQLQQVAIAYPSHKAAKKKLRKGIRSEHKYRYKARSIIFKEVSRLKNPKDHVVVFSDQQKQEVFSLLQPGDLVLTYTAGYMSDVFIPGAFKHGITYIGTEADRAPLGLSIDNLPANAIRYNPEALAANLAEQSLPNGQQIDMIEAVAEGVIFNNLEHIMDTHVDRMLVLRPRISAEERAQFIVEVYSYLGDGYDFLFDFTDSSMQVCTELIYRGINGKGLINFELTMRAGHETLSADDIANYYLNGQAGTFDFVLLVEPVPNSKKHPAAVYTGTEGKARLAALMEQVQAKADKARK
jgi:hypothetical protein